MECSICLEPLEEHVLTLECTHKFHSQCMLKYIETKKNNAECPLCRKKLVIPIPAPLDISQDTIQKIKLNKRCMLITSSLIAMTWLGMYIVILTIDK